MISNLATILASFHQEGYLGFVKMFII